MTRAAFGRRYTLEQQDACVRASFQDGMSAPRIQKTAAAGKLAGLGSFRPSVDTIRLWVAAERRAREEATAALGAPDYVASVLTKTVAVATLAVDRENTKMEKEGKRGAALDPIRLGRLTRAARDVLALSRELEQARGKGTSTVATAGQHAPEQTDWLSALPVDGDTPLDTQHSGDDAPGSDASAHSTAQRLEPEPRSVARFAFDASALELADVAREANR